MVLAPQYILENYNKTKKTYCNTLPSLGRGQHGAIPHQTEKRKKTMSRKKKRDVQDDIKDLNDSVNDKGFLGSVFGIVVLLLILIFGSVLLFG